MQIRTQLPAKQKGFSLLTGFILVIILFGSLAFFLVGQGINTGFATKYTNTAKASSLLTSAGYINTGFNAITLAGEAPENVTFDSAANTGVFNPTAGGATLQSVDPELLARKTTNVDGIWIYRGNDVRMKGVGDTSNTPDFTMMVSGLKKAICQQINYTLHGTALTTNPVSLGGADAAIFGTPTVSSGVGTTSSLALDLDAVVAVPSGRMSGCYATTTTVGSDVNYVYIHTLLAR